MKTDKVHKQLEKELTELFDKIIDAEIEKAKRIKRKPNNKSIK